LQPEQLSKWANSIHGSKSGKPFGNERLKLGDMARRNVAYVVDEMDKKTGFIGLQGAIASIKTRGLAEERQTFKKM